jgi:hypothetical protein
MSKVITFNFSQDVAWLNKYFQYSLIQLALKTSYSAM